MSLYTPAERATPIRMPSTANLQLDSADRNATLNPSPWDFQIQRNNSILNGFFTRIGTTEVVLEWKYGNGRSIGTINVDLAGVGNNDIELSQAFGFDPIFYTYEQALNTFVTLCNDAFGYPAWAPGDPVPNNGFYILENQPILISGNPQGIGVAANVGGVTTNTTFTGPGVDPMGFTSNITVPLQPITIPDLRAVRYLDFISPQLTYNQELKDSSTKTLVRDVLCRWYFAYDNPPVLDGYGFPILMGYTPFCLRRTFNLPKQIRWDPAQPIGNLTFQVYDDQDNLFSTIDIQPRSDSQWLMTLQVSEV